MQIGVQTDYKDGEQYPGVVYGIVPDEGQYGPSLKWLIWDADQKRAMVVFTPQTATPRNKLGRILVSLTGELTSIDTEELIGSTVNVHYTQSKTDATRVSPSNITARPAGKNEKIGDILKEANEFEASRNLDAPF